MTYEAIRDYEDGKYMRTNTASQFAKGGSGITDQQIKEEYSILEGVFNSEQIENIKLHD